jgi:uroporphyrinogen decarboxylase
MTGRQRVRAALRREVPDHVPCVPDLWEMVPIRLTGRPAWEILVDDEIPIWKVRMDAYRYFGVDAFFAVHVPLGPPSTAVVYRDDQKVIVREFSETEGRVSWSPYATVVFAKPPSAFVRASSIGLPATPEKWEVVHPRSSSTGRAYFEEARAYVGEDGVVAPMVSIPGIPVFEEEMLRYADDPAAVAEEMSRSGEAMMLQAETFLSWKPDALMIGNSGLLISNPPPTFRALGLQWLRRLTRTARACGVLTHMHCCGPERALVQIAAQETDLDGIEPLECPPMGDCDLAEIKRSFGKKLALKGNLHTTEVMLRAGPRDVEEACKRAIDAAAEGGGFILSTGDQTPREVRDETIRTMARVAETYGKY